MTDNRGITILRGIVGSTAYGLNHADSDIDRLGCYVAPTSQFHGLNIPQGKAASRVMTAPSDYTEHEAGKYLSLLLSCNPTVTELLWLPDELYEIVHPEGLALIAIRDKLLSARAVRNAYLGYANQQFKRLSERGDGSFSSDTRKRTEKHARHLKRLCWQGLTLYTTGVLPIKVEHPEEYHEFGREVAQDPEYASDLIKTYEHAFDLAETVLPDQPNTEVAEQWLTSVRARHYDGQLYTGLSPKQKALHYMTYLVNSDAVGYASVSACKNALDNLTKGFKSAKASS